MRELGPKLDALERALAAGSDPLTLRNDPDALAPECLLVFELRDHALASFMNAVESIDGLELIGEEDVIDEAQKTFLYLMIPTQAAINRLLSLWRFWKAGDPLPEDANKWDLVFQCLHDLRRWGPKDRISQEDAQVIAEQAALAPDSAARVEIELVFERRAAKADDLRARAEADLGRRGGRIIHRARITEIAYDALLVDISAAEAAALLDRDAQTLAGIPDLYAIRPQSMINVREDVEPTASAEAPDVEPTAPAIAAILDAVPVQNHPAFAAHVDLVDPDDLASKSVGIRAHGTAIVSTRGARRPQAQ